MSVVCLNCGHPAIGPEQTVCAKCGSRRLADLSKPLDAGAVLSKDDGRDERLRWDLRDLTVIGATVGVPLIAGIILVSVYLQSARDRRDRPEVSRPSVVAYLSERAVPATLMADFEATLNERALRAQSCMARAEPVGRHFVADFKRTSGGVSTAVRGTGGRLGECVAVQWLGEELDERFTRVEVPFEIDQSRALKVPMAVSVVYPPKPAKGSD